MKEKIESRDLFDIVQHYDVNTYECSMKVRSSDFVRF